MDINFTLGDDDAKLFLMAITKDSNISKYSDEALSTATVDAVKSAVYQVIANFEVQRAVEIKKAQMSQWVSSKMKGE